MEKLDKLDEAYLNYNSEEDSNGSIGMGIVDIVLKRYKTIENYKRHLELAHIQENSELANKLLLKNSLTEERNMKARKTHLGNIYNFIDETIKKDTDRK
jgi:hypothetical protein